MAYSDTIKYVVGDTRPVISIAVKDSNTAAAGKTLDPQDSTTWATISLASNDYVKMYIRKVGSTTLEATLTANVTSTSNGTADFTPTTATFASAGTYEGEIEISYSSGTIIQTVHDLVKFNVRDDFN